jgi:hypothetical protein
MLRSLFSNKGEIIEFALRLIAAVIMIQTLYFKFTGAEESVYIFSSLHAEPFGRYLTGVGEALASVLLFIPNLKYLGALLSFGMMIGAIAAHLFIIGIYINNDGGELFIFALTALICCSFVLIRGFQQKKITLKPLSL